MCRVFWPVLDELAHYRHTKCTLLNVFNYSLYTPDLSIRQAYFNAVRMMRGIGQQVFDRAEGLLARALVLLQDDSDAQTGPDVFAFCAVHGLPAIVFSSGKG